MEANNDDGTTIDFNSDWESYLQSSTDDADEEKIVADLDSHRHWSSMHMPHQPADVRENRIERKKWWYRKQFDWIPPGQISSQQHLYLTLADDHSTGTSNLSTSIWLNGHMIFSGVLTKAQEPIELPLKLLHNDSTRRLKRDNIIVVCCLDASLSRHARLVVRGRLICATGEVKYDDRNSRRTSESDATSDGLNYAVSMDDADGRIDVTFKPKRKSRVHSSSMKRVSEVPAEERQEKASRSDPDDELLVPRLAIVILMVGTRGDVQPFIAYV